MKSTWIVCIFLSTAFLSRAQITINKDTSDLTFKGTRISPYSIEYDTTGKVEFSAYLDTYYAGFTDTSGAGGFQKFPTISPRKNQFGINIVQFGAKYQSRRFRGMATLFWGDTPKSAWSQEFNLIQEAHLGFRIAGKLWIDAGFFRTHFGLESIQPRENMTMSIATTTYFEPYYLSGAKLTWEQSSKWMFQVNGFNGFNNFIENNRSKAIGASVSHTPTNKFNITASTIFSSESPDEKPIQYRSYTNLIMVYKTTRWTIGMEGNYGFQTKTVLTDSSKTAHIFSSLLAVKYRITPKWAIYGRGEFFSDPNEILTGPVLNENHQLVGLDIAGATLGGEFKPIPNSYFRVEGRALSTAKNEHIFQYRNHPSNVRYEFIVGLGVWF